MNKCKRVYNNLLFCFISISFIVSCSSKKEISYQINTYPANNEVEINPDTRLKITFQSKPKIGKSGTIRVFDSQTDSLVNLLDMSVPPGPVERKVNPKAAYSQVPYKYIDSNFTNANTKPGTPSGTAIPNSDTFQLTIIGGFTDAFHFYPIIVHENTAVIYLRNNLLEYNKTYYVLVDSGIVSPANGMFKGIYNKITWRFSTRKSPPDLKQNKFIVNDNGPSDFNTVQGALDYIPNHCKDTVEIFIKNGLYEELVYFRNKSNIIIKGENREKVIIQYANNEVFNPHPWNVKTNEWPGTFPSRRAAFAVDNCTDIQILNLTIKTLLKGQAEGLLINGNKIFVKDVNVVGSGDALQTNGPAYFENVKIDGGGDMILGRGPSFFKNCTFYSSGPFMWIRNTKTNHGNVFVNCRFSGTNPQGSKLARAPLNQGIYTYPYSEAVLINCSLKNIVPQGWGKVGGETKNIHYWEYNSINMDDGKPVDVKQRAHFSNQLSKEKDKKLIENYSNPSFILDGWNPKSYN